jgi:4-hydroxybenzoate polyprenyltransferase
MELENNYKHTREVLGIYNKDYLNQVIYITATITLVTYSLYVINIKNNYSIGGIILAVFGFLRYIFLVKVKKKGEDPERILFKDSFLLIAVLLWVLYNVIVIYL